jgi:hypothetical protein
MQLLPTTSFCRIFFQNGYHAKDSNNRTVVYVTSVLDRLIAYKLFPLEVAEYTFDGVEINSGSNTKLELIINPHPNQSILENYTYECTVKMYSSGSWITVSDYINQPSQFEPFIKYRLEDANGVVIAETGVDAF